jgi:hypothetical protein
MLCSPVTRVFTFREVNTCKTGQTWTYAYRSFAATKHLVRGELRLAA